MQLLIFLYGLFFSLPLTMLDVLPGGVKFDDIVLIMILGVYLYRELSTPGTVKMNKYFLLFIFITLSFAFFSFLISQFQSDPPLGDTPLTVLSRILQSLLIVFMLATNCLDIRSVTVLKKGIVIGTSISLLVFFVFFIMNVDVTKFSTRGVYFTKDIFQYNSYLPFSIHVNTLGSFFLIAFFIVYEMKNKLSFFSVIYLMPSIFLIGKGDIVAVSVFFALVLLSKIKNKTFIISLVVLIVMLSLPILYQEYLTLSQYRVYSSGRNEIYFAALTEILSNPIGSGLGYQNNVLFNLTGINYPAHNIFLSLSLELGVIYALILLLMSMIWLLKSSSEECKYIFICFLIIGLFGNAMYFYKYHTLALFFCFYGLWRPRQKNECIGNTQ